MNSGERPDLFEGLLGHLTGVIGHRPHRLAVGPLEVVLDRIVDRPEDPGVDELREEVILPERLHAGDAPPEALHDLGAGMADGRDRRTGGYDDPSSRHGRPGPPSSGCGLLNDPSGSHSLPLFRQELDIVDDLPDRPDLHGHLFLFVGQLGMEKTLDLQEQLDGIHAVELAGLAQVVVEAGIFHLELTAEDFENCTGYLHLLSSVSYRSGYSGDPFTGGL